MTPSPIAAQDRSEPPEGYEIYEADLSESDDPGWYWDADRWPFFDGAFPTRDAAIAAAWAHSEREQG